MARKQLKSVSKGGGKPNQRQTGGREQQGQEQVPRRMWRSRQKGGQREGARPEWKGPESQRWIRGEDTHGQPDASEHPDRFRSPARRAGLQRREAHGRTNRATAAMISLEEKNILVGMYFMTPPGRNICKVNPLKHIRLVYG